MTIPLFKLKKIVIARRQEGAYLDHEYKEGGYKETTIKGNVQPATPKELASNPEGEDIKAGIKVYTKDNISTGDLIRDKGSVYRVFGISPWGSHNKVLAGITDES